jgi:flavorubredoxin
MTRLDEIAPDIFRISTFFPEGNIQFNQFLLRDEEPVLINTGNRALLPGAREAVAKIIPLEHLRWIAFSHLEADECGALREWQQVAPRATALCSYVAKVVSVDDVVALRPARALRDGEILSTGKHRLMFLQTPHVPHAWDAGLFLEEISGALFCSDLFHQNGDVEPVTTGDVVGRFQEVLLDYQAGPFTNYLPYTTTTAQTLSRLAALEPKQLAAMHGSTYAGDGRKALQDVKRVLRELTKASWIEDSSDQAN